MIRQYTKTIEPSPEPPAQKAARIPTLNNLKNQTSIQLTPNTKITYAPVSVRSRNSSNPSLVNYSKPGVKVVKVGHSRADLSSLSPVKVIRQRSYIEEENGDRTEVKNGRHTTQVYIQDRNGLRDGSREKRIVNSVKSVERNRTRGDRNYNRKTTYVKRDPNKLRYSEPKKARKSGFEQKNNAKIYTDLDIAGSDKFLKYHNSKTPGIAEEESFDDIDIAEKIYKRSLKEMKENRTSLQVNNLKIPYNEPVTVNTMESRTNYRNQFGQDYRGQGRGQPMPGSIYDTQKRGGSQNMNFVTNEKMTRPEGKFIQRKTVPWNTSQHKWSQSQSNLNMPQSQNRGRQNQGFRHEGYPNTSQKMKEQWYNGLIGDYQSECRKLRNLLRDQLQKPKRNQKGDSDTSNQNKENLVLLQELLMKRQQVGTLENENKNLVHQFLKSKQERTGTLPVKVLEQLLKDKNEVILYILERLGNIWEFICTR